MVKWLKALLICTVLQIFASTGAIVYLETHNANMAREYALLSEQNANAFAAASVMNLRNEMLHQLEIERITTTNEITKAIELANARSKLQGK